MRAHEGWSAVIVAMLCANSACAGMLGYETLEDADTAPMPARDASTPPSEDAAPIEAAPSEPATLYAASVLADRPLAYFRFDAPNAARDYAGRLELAVRGATTLVPGAIARDDSTQISLGVKASGYLDFAAVPLRRDGAFTIEAWLSLASGNVGGVQSTSTFLFLGRRDAVGALGSLQVDVVPATAGEVGSQLVVSSQGSSNGAEPKLRAPFAGFATRTVHVAIVSDGAAISLWVGGVSYGKVPAAKLDGPSQELRLIGASVFAPDGMMPAWNGTVDELAFYDHVLGPERIAEHYAIGMGKK